MTLPFHGRQLCIHNRIDQTRRTLTLTFVIDLQLIAFQRIEAHFDAFARQLRWRFKEPVVQQEGGIAPHQAIQTMEEQAAQIGGGRQLPDVLDIALPAQQRRGVQGAVFGAVINIDPLPQALVQLLQSEQRFPVKIGEKLFPHRTEVALDIAAPFGLVGRRVHDENADGGGDARQLRRA